MYCDNTKFTGATLINAKLMRAAISGADFRNAILCGADLTDAYWHHTSDWDGAISCADFSGAYYDSYTKWPRSAGSAPSGTVKVDWIYWLGRPRNAEDIREAEMQNEIIRDRESQGRCRYCGGKLSFFEWWFRNVHKDCYTFRK